MQTVLLFLLLAFFSCLQANAQEPDEAIDWSKKIVGSWKINHPKTAELASHGPQKEYAQELSMIPLASPGVKFTSKTIAFETNSNPQNYEFKAYDPASNRIELSVKNEGRESTIHFNARDINTLILDLPASVLGPLQIVYSRTQPAGNVAPDSPLAELTGDWKLEKVLTRAMWKKMLSKERLKNYSSIGADELSKTIQISFSHILYSDQTFEPWNLKVHEGSKFLLQSTDRPQFNIEIHKISADLIQIADGRKRLFAIYSRGNNEQEKARALTKFPENAVASSFLSGFSQPPASALKSPPSYAPPKKAPAIGIDGDVEILEIDVRRRQNSGAVVNADIINMSIDLLLQSQFKYKSVMGGYLIDLTRLDDVFDNRGKLLSPKRRRDSIQFLNSPTGPRLTTQGGFGKMTHGSSGVSFPIKLDAPELGATELKRIAGEVKLVSYEPRLIRFENIGQQQNIPLKHPLLKGMVVRPKIRNGPHPEFAIKTNQKDQKRILNWYLVTAQGERLTSGSTGRSNSEITQGYSSPIPNDVTLVLEVVLEKSSQTMPFEFKDIKLR